MIAKITRSRGSAVELAAYLHGPGKGTEHRWTDQDGRQHAGGIVVSSSAPGQEGATSGRTWARWMDRATRARPDIRSAPLWHCSLNLAPHDRRLSAEEWRDAVVQFLDAMGVPDSAVWVAVQHDDRGVHLVVGRITDDGLVRTARDTDHEGGPAGAARAAAAGPGRGRRRGVPCRVRRRRPNRAGRRCRRWTRWAETAGGAA